MLKKLLFIILISYFSFLPRKSLASCDFKTAKYLEDLGKPNFIKEIDINVPNSKKYVINLVKAYLSSSTSRRAISQKYKKKFNADIKVKYKFGECLYKGKIWQNGDWKDHIKSENGNFFRSLNVKLEDGNIFNATKFKLLIPETRNGRHEILATLILKNLDLITPETFEVKTIVNGTRSNMIFQEDSQKEMLERNLRREGPIFEGDESLIWSKKQYELVAGVGGGGLEFFSLAKLINSNWFLKGVNSQNITLNAFYKIQNAYLKYADQNIEGFNIFPNESSIDKFAEYNFLMLAMNGTHALRPHNRKYFFNSLSNEFEPIYYDGDIDFSNNSKFVENFSDYGLENLFLNKKYYFPHQFKINNPDFFKKIKSQFKLRVLNYEKKDDYFLDKSYKNFLKNTKDIQKKIINQKVNSKKNENMQNLRASFIKRISFFDVERNIIDDLKINGNKVSLFLNDGSNELVDLSDFSRIIRRKKYLDKRYLYIPVKNNFKPNENLLKTKIESIDSEIVHTNKTRIILDKESKTKKLFIYQYHPNDTILFKGGTLKDVEIIFLGSNHDSYNKNVYQRFNNQGLTGCLNIYNSFLKNVSFDLNNGKCEDSLNLVNVKGNVSSIVINDAYQDALDIDFSDLSIDKVLINKSGNDCIDLSAGSYNLNFAELIKCEDKAISIGEKSFLNSKNVFIDKSSVGIAVKDLSIYNGIKQDISNTPVCLQVFKKKQEFGGAYANLNSINCKGRYEVDKDSILEN